MPSTRETVRLSRGSHRSPSAGVCVMELASMLAHEPFSDRARTVSPVIGAFLRTYNDGVDDERRQDLCVVAPEVLGTGGDRHAEGERAAACLAFARRRGRPLPTGRAAMAMATPEAAGAWAATSLLRREPSPEAHAEALAFVERLVALGDEVPAVQRGPWRRLSRWLTSGVGAAATPRQTSSHRTTHTVGVPDALPRSRSESRRNPSASAAAAPPS